MCIRDSDEGLIDEKKYQVLRLKEGKKNILKYFQYYSALSSSMVNSIQEAEIASVEAKYAVPVSYTHLFVIAWICCSKAGRRRQKRTIRL